MATQGSRGEGGAGRSGGRRGRESRRSLKGRAWRALLEGTSELSQRLDAELQRAAGLDLRTYDVLLHVGEGEGGRRMVDLARAVVMSKSGLTALVDRLEADGFLERRPDPDDRRVTRIGLTERGADAFDEATPHHRAIVHRIFLDLVTEEEADTMLGALTRVREALAIGG